MNTNDNINNQDISIETLRNLLTNDDGTSLFGDLDISKAILDSENLVKKNIDDLMSQFKDFKTDIYFVNKSNNPDPVYAHKGDSGFDFRAFISESIDLQPGEWKAIPTGLYFEIPTGYELQVRPRSGLSFKNGVTVLNSPGTVDSGYRGEIQVILINHSKTIFTIENGDRVAQGVISPVLTSEIANLNKVPSLNESERGEGKFGSTGTK